MDYWKMRKLLNERWELTTNKIEKQDENINDVFAKVDNELNELFN
jgi:hypothetical protein